MSEREGSEAPRWVRPDGGEPTRALDRGTGQVEPFEMRVDTDIEVEVPEDGPDLEQALRDLRPTLQGLLKESAPTASQQPDLDVTTGVISLVGDRERGVRTLDEPELPPAPRMERSSRVEAVPVGVHQEPSFAQRVADEALAELNNQS